MVLLAAFARPPSRCDPCSFRPPLLYSSCTGGPASLPCPYADRKCTKKRQGKVCEKQAWNIWNWLKNWSGSQNGQDLGTDGEQNSSMSDRISCIVFKDGHSGMRAVYPALSLPQLRRRRLTVSWDTP